MAQQDKGMKVGMLPVGTKIGKNVGFGLDKICF